MESDRYVGKRFWPLVYYTLDISAASTLDGKSIVADNSTHVTEYYDEVYITHTREEREKLMDCIDEFCNDHPRTFLHISLIGDLPPNPELSIYRVNGPRLFFRH